MDTNTTPVSDMTFDQLVECVKKKYPYNNEKTNKVLNLITVINNNIKRYRKEYGDILYIYLLSEYKSHDIQRQTSFQEFKLLVNSINAVDTSLPHDIQKFIKSNLDPPNKDHIKYVARNMYEYHKNYLKKVKEETDKMYNYLFVKPGEFKNMLN